MTVCFIFQISGNITSNSQESSEHDSNCPVSDNSSLSPSKRLMPQVAAHLHSKSSKKLRTSGVNDNAADCLDDGKGFKYKYIKYYSTCNDNYKMDNAIDYMGMPRLQDF